MNRQYNGFAIRTGTNVAGSWFAIAIPINHETTLVTEHHDDELDAIEVIEDIIDEYMDAAAIVELAAVFGSDNVAIIDADEVE